MLWWTWVCKDLFQVWLWFWLLIQRIGSWLGFMHLFSLNCHTGFLQQLYQFQFLLESLPIFRFQKVGQKYMGINCCSSQITFHNLNISSLNTCHFFFPHWVAHNMLLYFQLNWALQILLCCFRVQWLRAQDVLLLSAAGLVLYLGLFDP